ncbi:MAG: hypothetical protein ACF8OB_09795 [Phycisphaeraceae bacterium JB051]
MKPVYRVLSVLLMLLLVSASWAQQPGAQLMLSQGQVQMGDPVDRMSSQAVGYLQLNNLGALLKDVDGLVMSALPDALVPPDIKPLLDSPTPVLSLLGIQTLGMPLTPEALEQMLGLDFSAKAALALYPAPGEPKLALFLPVKNHLAVSGLITQILRPQHLSRFTEQGHELCMVEVGNNDLPPRMFVASTKDGVLLSNDAALILSALDPQPQSDAYIKAQMTKLGDNCDLSLVINPQPLMPMLAMLPRLRPQLEAGLDMAIGRALGDLTPPQLTQINTELRWRLGVNDINTVMLFGKSVAMGTFDTFVEEFTVGMQNSRGVMLGLDLSSTHQTIMFDVDSDALAKQNRLSAINLGQVKQAMMQLDLPWSQVSVTGKQLQASKSQWMLKLMTNTRQQLVDNQVPTRILDACLEIYNKQHTPRQVQELSDWTLSSRLVFEPENKPAGFSTLAKYMASFNDVEAQPFATNMMVMPKLDAGKLDAHFQSQAQEKTDDLAMTNNELAKLYSGAKPQIVRSYSVLKKDVGDQINQYIKQTHIKTKFGIFGFNEHELISRRNLFATDVGAYTVLHDGAANHKRLSAVKQSQAHSLDPILAEVIDGLPEGTSYFEYVRTLQNLPQILAFAGELEDLIHRDVTRYVDEVNKLAKAPGMTKAKFEQAVLQIPDMPLLYQSLRMNPEKKELYATLPLGLAMPRPKICPVIQSLIADFADHVDDEGGAVMSSRQVGSESQLRITQDTRLFGRLIKSLGNAIAKRYLNGGNPVAKVMGDVFSPMDGNAEFQELHHNPMWEMLLTDPQIERGFWENMPLGPMADGGDAGEQPQPQRGARVVEVYFMDTADGSIFTAKSDQLPPITAPSGKHGVRAFVFACGDCGDEANRFIGWLETYTPEAKKAIYQPVTGPEGGMAKFEMIENGHLIAAPDSTGVWIKANSKDGFMLMDKIQGKCGNQAPKPCFPGR